MEAGTWEPGRSPACDIPLLLGTTILPPALGCGDGKGHPKIVNKSELPQTFVLNSVLSVGPEPGKISHNVPGTGCGPSALCLRPLHPPSLPPSSCKAGGPWTSAGPRQFTVEDVSQGAVGLATAGTCARATQRCPSLWGPERRTARADGPWGEGPKERDPVSTRASVMLPELMSPDARHVMSLISFPARRVFSGAWAIAHVLVVVSPFFSPFLGQGYQGGAAEPSQGRGSVPKSPRGALFISSSPVA